MTYFVKHSASQPWESLGICQLGICLFQLSSFHTNWRDSNMDLQNVWMMWEWLKSHMEYNVSVQ